MWRRSERIVAREFGLESATSQNRSTTAGSKIASRSKGKPWAVAHLAIK